MKTRQAGYCEVKIDKRTVAFKFGTNAFSLFCEMHGIELNEMDKVLGAGDSVNIAAMRDLVFCGAKAAALSAGIEVDFNQYTMGDWIDAMPQKDYEGIMQALANTQVLGQSISGEVEKKV